MRNPIFQSKQNTKLYLFLWLMIMAMHVSINVLSEKVTLDQALIDTVVSDVLFAGMAIGLWYPIRYLNIETQPIWTFLFHHLGMAITFLLIWSSTVSCSISMLIEDPLYLFLFDQSLPWRVMTTFLFYCLTVLGYYLYIYYSSFKQKQLVELELKSLVKETELNLLKSQLNPHFIFNSLNSISSLTISNPNSAQEMVVKLSSYIRYALNQNGNELVSFSDELENSKLYLAIEKIRFGAKLILEDTCCNSCLDAQVPNMLLQPLLENAIKHGVYESIEPVSILLKSEMVDRALKVSILNNYEAEGRVRQGSGIGLKNIKERLFLLYGEHGLMKIKDENHQFLVEIFVPQSY